MRYYESIALEINGQTFDCEVEFDHHQGLDEVAIIKASVEVGNQRVGVPVELLQHNEYVTEQLFERVDAEREAA